MSLTAALSRLVPARLVGAAVRAVYPRVEPELARLAEFVPAGGTAVDVGGWYGPWTARLRRRAERVVTVEPDPDLAALLRRAFPGVRVIEAACSDRDGEARLWIPDGPDRRAGVSSVVHRVGRPLTVPAITLDSLGLADVRFVKLDIEGHELAALHGAEKTVRRDRPVLLVELEERHQPVAKVLDLLISWDYTPYVLPARDWIPAAGFPLATHQEETAARLTRGLMRHALNPNPRYVNSVLFRP